MAAPLIDRHRATPAPDRTDVDLLGRRAECTDIDRLLADASGGRSGVLVVRGEAGIGKTALLRYARNRAVSIGMRVESSVGVEAEAQFAFAGLHQLCATLIDRAQSLPAPQRIALDVALGRTTGDPPDRFLVALAVLNILADS